MAEWDGMIPRRILVRMRDRLDRSPLPAADSVRLELEAELVDLLVVAQELDAARARGSGGEA